MSQRTADICDAHMWTYRGHLRSLNRRLAEDYIHQHGQRVVVALQELAQAAPVTLAIAQLHRAIRTSPAGDFWPVIRKTKGVLLLRSSGAGLDCPWPSPWPWRRTTTGNLRYDLPGHLVFSPWPPNVRRRVRNLTIQLERALHMIQSMPDIGNVWFQILPDVIFYKTREAKRLIDAIKGFRALRCRTALRLSTDGPMIPCAVRTSCCGFRTGRSSITTVRSGAPLLSRTRSAGPSASPRHPTTRWNGHWVRAGARSYNP
jgi:hypothetical protein